MKQLSTNELIEFYNMINEIQSTLKDYKHVSKYLPTTLTYQLASLLNDSIIELNERN